MAQAHLEAGGADEKKATGRWPERMRADAISPGCGAGVRPSAHPPLTILAMATLGKGP